jgi:sterol desaturase/sphingolipid hydroxylase (fatty acid hydroxylase superfamily)
LIDPHSLYLVRLAYFGAFIGTWAFLVVVEGGSPKWGLPASRWRHIARNFALFLLAVAIADGVVGIGLLGLWDRLNIQPSGLLTPLGLPLWALVIAGLLATDLAGYAFHRLCHRWRPLWLVHSVHHSDRQLDASTAVREHPAEMICDVVILAGTLTALGIPLWVEGLRAAFLNPQAMVQHANIEYPRWVERAFGWLLVTPAMHRVHHSPDPRETNTNYAIMFSFWDRLFGTYRAPESEPAANFGLERLHAERWQTVGGMLLTPVAAREIPTL